MLLKELRDRMIRELGAIYPENESISIVQMLLSSVAGVEKKDLVITPGIEADEQLISVFKDKMTELLAHKPVQYVTGRAYFYGLELEVNPSVLIPRPETEELVKWIGDDNKSKEGLKILDIGTGSGCIILALGRLLKDPQLTALDISVGALLTASENAAKYSIPVDLLQFDFLDKNQWENLGKFDLIVSNPPYVMESEKGLMRMNVLDYEPHGALFVPDDDALVFYRAIAKFAKDHLVDNGSLYLEINENLGTEVVELLQKDGFSDVVLRKDLRRKTRMIAARLLNKPQ